MPDSLKISIPKEEQEEIKEFISILTLLTKEDREMLLENAHAFWIRSEIEQAGKGRR